MSLNPIFSLNDKSTESFPAVCDPKEKNILKHCSYPAWSNMGLKSERSKLSDHQKLSLEFHVHSPLLCNEWSFYPDIFSIKPSNRNPLHGSCLSSKGSTKKLINPAMLLSIPLYSNFNFIVTGIHVCTKSENKWNLN